MKGGERPTSPSGSSAGVSPAVSSRSATPSNASSVSADGLGTNAVISGLIAVVFLVLGQRFAHWAIATLAGRSFDTGVTWTQGEQAGQTVAYFDLQLGAAWLDVGLFATGVALLLEAICYGLAAGRVVPARPAILAAFAIVLLGCGANLLSAAMQVRAGYPQPVFALLGLAVCAVSAVGAWRRLRGPAGA